MPIKILKLQAGEETVWNSYVEKNNGSIYHHANWRHLIKDVFGHESHYLYAEDEEERILGVLPLIQLKSLLFGNYLVSMPYFNYGGCIADTKEVATKLIDRAEVLRQELNCSHAEIRETEKNRYKLPTRIDKVSVLLDLPSSVDLLWKTVGSKIRAQIKRPIREGVEFELGGVELVDDFYHVFSINMRDLGTPVYSEVFFYAIFKRFPEKAKIALVRLDGDPVACGFLLGHNGIMQIPWASTLRKVNKISVNMFLYWNILKSAIEQDYQVFDFGRSSLDSGTLRFKKQWGGKEKSLYWYYLLSEGEAVPQLNPQNTNYSLMIRLWKNMPLPVCNFLGPHIVKGLP